MAKGFKTGGRVAGTPNKTTSFTKGVIQDILNNYVDSELLQADLKALEPKDRLDVIVKLTAFVVPKPQSIDVNLNERPKTIEDTLSQLSEENEK